MKKVALLFIVLLLFSSCANMRNKKIRKYITRTWVIDNLILNVNAVFISNVMSLKKNNKGEVPSILGDKEGWKMNWKLIITKDEVVYIKIYNSKYDFFNHTFRVHTIKGSECDRMQMTFKNIKLNCTALNCHLGIYSS